MKGSHSKKSRGRSNAAGEAAQWQHLAAHVLQLTFACPFDQRNPTFCPLFKVRSESLDERMKWVEGLELSQMKEMVKRHELCLQLKQSQSGGF